MMSSPRVYGPYPARKGLRLVILEGSARKSVIVASVAEAEKVRADLEAALRQRSGRSIAVALGEYEDYLLHTRGAATAPHIARAIARFIGEDGMLGDISPARASAMYESETRRVLGGKGQTVAAASHRTLLGQCKRFYAWAVERGYASENPFASVKPVGKPKVGKAQLRIDEARRFVATAMAQAQAGDPAATASLLALMLGMRAGEVLARIVRDLDDGGRVLWITRGKTDNARRRLEIPEVLRPCMRRLADGKSPHELLFGESPIHAGKPLTDAWLWGHVRRLCDEAGVPRVSTHSLRGLHSTLAIEAGATSTAVAAALGHGSFQITAKHYAAPGAIERARSKSVEQALSGEDAELDPAALVRLLQRLPAHLRAEVRKALDEPKESE